MFQPSGIRLVALTNALFMFLTAANAQELTPPQLQIYPPLIQLDNARDSQRIIAVVTGPDGVTHDVTAELEFEVADAEVAQAEVAQAEVAQSTAVAAHDAVTHDETGVRTGADEAVGADAGAADQPTDDDAMTHGEVQPFSSATIIRPVADGQTQLAVTWQDQTALVPIEVHRAAESPAMSFRLDVVPVLTALVAIRGHVTVPRGARTDFACRCLALIRRATTCGSRGS